MTMGKWNCIGEIWGFHSINVEDSGFIGCYAVAAQHSNVADSLSWCQRLSEFILSLNDRNNRFFFQLMTKIELFSAFGWWYGTGLCFQPLTERTSFICLFLTSIHLHTLMTLNYLWYFTINCTNADVQLRTPDDGQKDCLKHVES
jgi:hypothetical protein